MLRIGQARSRRKGDNFGHMTILVTLDEVRELAPTMTRHQNAASAAMVENHYESVARFQPHLRNGVGICSKPLIAQGSDATR